MVRAYNTWLPTTSVAFALLHFFGPAIFFVSFCGSPQDPYKEYVGVAIQPFCPNEKCSHVVLVHWNGKIFFDTANYRRLGLEVAVAFGGRGSFYNSLFLVWITAFLFSQIAKATKAKQHSLKQTIYLSTKTKDET